MDQIISGLQWPADEALQRNVLKDVRGYRGIEACTKHFKLLHEQPGVSDMCKDLLSSSFGQSVGDAMPPEAIKALANELFKEAGRQEDESAKKKYFLGALVAYLFGLYRLKEIGDASYNHGELAVVLATNSAQAAFRTGLYEFGLRSAEFAIVSDTSRLKGYYWAVKCAAAIPEYVTARLHRELFQLGMGRGDGAKDDANFTQLGKELFPEGTPAPIVSKEFKGTAELAAGKICTILVKTHLKLEEKWLEPNDPIFKEAYLSPVLGDIGIPIAVYRYAKAQLPQSKETDNQLATFFMVEKPSGLAPPFWQWGIGPVVICRKDGKHISEDEVWGLWDFFNVMMDEFGDPPPPKMNKRDYLRWQISYNDLPMVQDGRSKRIELLPEDC